ncbi:hypothetical protein BDP27DRAFT_1438882 [Rhodocollybia butyracea]|uniref:Uncharacterized protein n=1 Tax=Rhodocollybia butyracea TaxID=206335 RepID=A0A9P5P2Z2_9AGAR|nr:hypothetical protein BDP27DRAFT_1438882 [Rhodocollybia butyracea]
MATIHIHTPPTIHIQAPSTIHVQAPPTVHLYKSLTLLGHIALPMPSQPSLSRKAATRVETEHPRTNHLGPPPHISKPFARSSEQGVHSYQGSDLAQALQHQPPPPPIWSGLNHQLPVPREHEGIGPQQDNSLSWALQRQPPPPLESSQM